MISCKKEEDDYPNEDYFIAQMKRGWYVAHYNPKDFSHEVYAFDGDSTISIGYSGDYCYLGDSILCTLKGIEYIQYWEITGTKGNLHLKTQDLCGGVNHFTFSYTYYGGIEFLTLGLIGLRANIQLIGQDSIATLYCWDFDIEPKPDRNRMRFYLEDDYERYFIMHPIN
jgi:hypothetical protein